MLMDVRKTNKMYSVYIGTRTISYICLQQSNYNKLNLHIIICTQNHIYILNGRDFLYVHNIYDIKLWLLLYVLIDCAYNKHITLSCGLSAELLSRHQVNTSSSSLARYSQRLFGVSYAIAHSECRRLLHDCHGASFT